MYLGGVRTCICFRPQIRAGGLFSPFVWRWCLDECPPGGTCLAFQRRVRVCVPEMFLPSVQAGRFSHSQDAASRKVGTGASFAWLRVRREKVAFRSAKSDARPSLRGKKSKLHVPRASDRFSVGYAAEAARLRYHVECIFKTFEHIRAGTNSIEMMSDLEGHEQLPDSFKGTVSPSAYVRYAGRDSVICLRVGRALDSTQC